MRVPARAWLLAVVAALTLGASACAPSAPPAEPLPPDQLDAVGAYLHQIAQVNRDGSSSRLRLRWWIADVPVSLWEGRGTSLRSLQGEINQYQQDNDQLVTEMKAISAIPPVASDANGAVMASYDATGTMLDLYRQVIDEYRNDEINGSARPPKEARDPELAAARTAADQATARAEQALTVLLARYRASSTSA